MPVEIRLDDLSGAPTRALAAAHLKGMRENTPAESCHALDVDALSDERVTMWSAWVDGELAGIGALAELDPGETGERSAEHTAERSGERSGAGDGASERQGERRDERRGELKSMRVTESFLGQGIGRAVLRHIVEEARGRGIRSLWLETGSTDDFIAARRLYASEGFVECAAFAPYTPDPLSTFMMREL